MRRALVPILLAAGAFAAPAAAQVYDRYGAGPGGAAYGAPPWQTAPAHVLSWSGKQVQPTPQMAPPMGYPQQQPQAYPQPQAYGYPQQGYYPSIQPQPAGYPQNQQMPPYREGPLQGMPTYEMMQDQKARAMQMTPPQPFPIMNTPPRGAWAYQPGAYPQPQPQQQAYPQQAYPQQAYPQPAPAAFAPPQAQPYPMQGQPMMGQPVMGQPMQAQPMMGAPMMGPPGMMPGGGDPTVSAAPTTPVQGQPLPTNIYAPAAPRADLHSPSEPASADGQRQPSAGGGPNALASLDYGVQPVNDTRSPGVRHYSVHRPFGMSPDPVPAPVLDNQVLIAQGPENPEASGQLADDAEVGLRGVGVEQRDAPKKSAD